VNTLSLDIGLRRTGVAYYSDEVAVPVALDTLKHKSVQSLIEQILPLLKERNIDRVVCGLPLLLSGEEGAQCALVRDVTEALQENGVEIALLDERYSTPSINEIDPDAAAACQLLLTFIDREKRIK
jgi:putative transcription antitermination factor YqgF